jgi:hypothetical protein
VGLLIVWTMETGVYKPLWISTSNNGWFKKLCPLADHILEHSNSLTSFLQDTVLILIVFLGSCYGILLFDLGPEQEIFFLWTPSQIWVHVFAKVLQYLPVLHGYLIF